MSFRREQKRTSLVPRRMTAENQSRYLDVFQKNDIDKNGELTFLTVPLIITSL